jgi:hypothetical protein
VSAVADVPSDELLDDDDELELLEPQPAKSPTVIATHISAASTLFFI